MPKLIAELRLTYADGRTVTIGTDEEWKAARGPVGFSSIYGGEDYDARREQPGWDRTGFDASAWSTATVTDGPGGLLIPAIAPDVQVIHEFTSVKATEVVPRRIVYDFGQNFAGRPQIKVEGPAGATLKLIPGDVLKADGTVTQLSSGGPMYWTYTLKGGGPETWEPRLEYYGFRYLQAEWSVDSAAKIVEVKGRRISSIAPVTGEFASSNEMLNAIHKLIVEAMHNNEVSLFTDCPHREKLGWLEETHLVAAGLMFNNDLRGLYAATDRNIADAQHEDGGVPTIAPQYTRFGPQYPVYDDSPEWGSASVLAPWAAYRFYGDKAELERAYPAMARYVAFLVSKAKDGIVAYGLSDWYDMSPGDPGISKLTTLGVTATLMLYEDATAMEKIAGLLGHTGDAAKYAALAETTKTAFNARFFDAAQGFYDKGSQTAQAMPLALGIVPKANEAGVLQKLIDDIHAHEDHITTGEVGFPYLLRTLMEHGRSDVVMALMMRKDAPSYGSQLAAGATALTEAWDGNPRHSQDHFMLGGGEEWFYRGLSGIDIDMSRAKAAERITIHPQVVDGVDWVKTSYRSVLGMVTVEWRREKSGALNVDVTMPVEGTYIWAGGILPLRRGTSHFVETATRY